MKFPEAFESSKREYLARFTRLSAHKARKVITVSENTRRDAIELLDIPPEKAVVIPNGVDDCFQPITDQNILREFRIRHRLPDKVILFVGTIEPRKNITTLIRAFDCLRKTRVVEHKLVIAGSRGWMYESVFALVKELGLTKDVVFPGYIPPNDLPLWYNTADVFVYPSLYEGFGLPPLEAMACGTPVVTSNVSALPEVVGKAGLLLDPRDFTSWAEGIDRVLTDDDLHQQLSEAGLHRAAAFSWERTAVATAELYWSIIGDRKRKHV